jgi:hypothetical protein
VLLDVVNNGLQRLHRVGRKKNLLLFRLFEKPVIPMATGPWSSWEFSAPAWYDFITDDWMPPRNWDVELENRMDTSKAQVLAVSDGHRTDDLLCMAILTRKRLIEQGYLFHPDFLGVYSDNWFTRQAYKDGVVVEAKDVIFTHNHPAFNESVEIDQTYALQNSDAAYLYGKEIFERLVREEEAK